MNRHIQIELANRITSKGWRVTIDGRELRGVTDVKINQPFGDTSRVMIEFAAEMVTIIQEVGGVRVAPE